jgi:hypothetical protein
MKPADDGSPMAICCGKEVLPEAFVHPINYTIGVAWECPVCRETAIQYTHVRADVNHAFIEEGVSKPGTEHK